MKMKKYFKAVCMALVFCFLLSYTMPIINVEAAQTRTILRYARNAKSENGLLWVYVSLSVQDSAGEIIGYHIDDIVKFNGVTDVEILEQGLDKNNTRVYVHFRYYFYGNLRVDSAYIDM
ncbi:MAG: hypothetical protein NC086_05675 [Alistipes sp.]|nr:hypothetical protein [Alistipes sp.]